MKRKPLLLVSLFVSSLVLCGTISAQDDYSVKRGYVGFLEQSNAFAFQDGMSTFALATTHGCQFNENVYVGAGLSLLWNKNAFVAPIYTAFRYNFTEKKILPFGQLRLGYYIGEGSGQYADAAFGLRFGTPRKFAFSVMIGASYLTTLKDVIYVYDENGYYRKDANMSNVSLRFAIEW